MDIFSDPGTGRRYVVDHPGGKPRWIDPPPSHPLAAATEPPATSTPKPRTAAGISGLVVAGLALLLSWVPIVNNLAFLLALVSGLLATVGLVATRRAGRRSSRWTATTAMVLMVLSMGIVLGTQAFYGKVLGSASKGFQDGLKGTAVPASGGASTKGAGGSSLPHGATRFGTAVTFSDGSTLACARPVAFQRDRYAAGGEHAAAFLKSRCTFTNRSAKPFEAAATTGSMSAGGVEGESVFQSGLDTPDNPVLPGRSVSWWMGYGVASASAVQLTVRLGFLDYAAVTFV